MTEHDSEYSVASLNQPLLTLLMSQFIEIS
jgi:hypothetical protein